MKVIDLTHMIESTMPVYPGTEPPIFEPANTYEKDGFKETKITMFTHTGTHMDPPAHLYQGRTTLDAFSADQFIGKALFIKKYKYARRIVQLLVGLYMLIYLGLICNENMQIEGFWYYLFTGVFEAATIHYAVAKIFGPLLFGIGWCGYACWTAMVLDFLPYKSPSQPRKKLGWIRYITFTASLVFVASLFLAKVGNIERIMFWAFIVGNLAYICCAGAVFVYRYHMILRIL